MKSLNCDGCGSEHEFDGIGVPKDWYRMKVELFERSMSIGQVTKLDLCQACGKKAEQTKGKQLREIFLKVFGFK